MHIYTHMLLEKELFFHGHLRNVRVGMYHFNPKVTARLFTNYGSRISNHSPNHQTVFEVNYLVKADLQNSFQNGCLQNENAFKNLPSQESSAKFHYQEWK